MKHHHLHHHNNDHHHEPSEAMVPPPRVLPPPSQKDILMRRIKEMPPAELKSLFMELCSPNTTLATPIQLVAVMWVFVNDETIRKQIVDCGAIPALVRHLRVPPELGLNVDVEAISAQTLSLLAKSGLEYQQLIIEAGAVPLLVDLLKRTHDRLNSPRVISLLGGVISSIAHLAYGNSDVKTIVRVEGGIPPLVKLLWFVDERIRKLAVFALANLGTDSVENKNQIIDNNEVLDRLILMLRSKDPEVQGQVICLIGMLVRSYPYIRSRVTDGALHLVIGILSSSSSDTQSRAANLIGLLADASSDCKVHIAQRGAIRPLIEMLHSSDAETRRQSVFTLNVLAKDTQNQAGIAQCGGILPLMELLDLNCELTKRNAVAALCMVVRNEDTVVEFIEMGCFQKLQNMENIHQSSRDLVTYTFNKLKKKIQGRLLSHLLNLIPDAEKDVQRRVFVALAHLSRPADYKTIFIDYGGLELLFELMKSSNVQNQREGSRGLSKLVAKSILFKTDIVTAPQPMVYPGELYVNNPYVADVTFLVEGVRFFAHKICLIESSDVFRRMFEGEFAERNIEEIVIPNIRFDVFTLMMTYIYTGTIEVDTSIAYSLLIAADQYLLTDLKCLCENAIKQDITVDTIPILMEFSETYSASSLRRSCILFILKKFDIMRLFPWYPPLVQVILPEIHVFLLRDLSRTFTM